MGLADDGYMDEDMEEGPGEGEGPMEGEGRTWEGGADGGSIIELDGGGFELGACCCNREVVHMVVKYKEWRSTAVRPSSWFLGSWVQAVGKASQLGRECRQYFGGCPAQTPSVQLHKEI